MPCLNEARTVEACIKQARDGCEELKSAKATVTDNGSAYEIIIADNGSVDGSQEIAERAGARVVSIAQRG